VTFAAYLLALIIGLIVGILRLSTNPVIYHVTTVYVEVMRGLPMLVIVLYAGFVIRRPSGMPRAASSTRP